MNDSGQAPHWKDRPHADVSVVIPCYRCKDTIGRAISSVAAQTHRPTEVILIEDCSGDGTIDVLRDLQSQHPAGWIQIIQMTANSGPGSARNVGWDRASGRFIAFLDADDAWHHAKIALQLEWMEHHPEAALLGTATRVESTAANHYPAGTSHRSPHRIPHATEVSPYRLLFQNQFSTPTILLKRSLPFRFADGKRYAEDYLLWTQIALSKERCFRLPLELTFLYKPRFGAGGLSANQWEMYKGILDSYIQLLHLGCIGPGTLLLLFPWSLLKLVRRTVQTYVQ